MIQVAEQWNPKQARLKSLISKTNSFEEAINAALELHSMVHTSEMSNTNVHTYEDEVWDELPRSVFITMPAEKDVTIAWNIWHITRIEDITANMLIAGESQVINKGNWHSKMNVTVCDTGNAMTDAEIMNLSTAINMQELRNYRIAVGRKTREILNNLKPEDLKKKVAPAGLQRILAEGGVLDVENSRWLLDFWGAKTIGGIILMPITRHQVVHINDCLKLKKKCMRKREKSL